MTGDTEGQEWNSIAKHKIQSQLKSRDIVSKEQGNGLETKDWDKPGKATCVQ